MDCSMKRLLIAGPFALFVAGNIFAGPSVATGAAPQGDAKKVATRIIRYNFPTCKRVTSAVRLTDGSIRATCDGFDYRVFTVFNAQQGKMLEVAMNCTAAKQLLNISCY